MKKLTTRIVGHFCFIVTLRQKSKSFESPSVIYRLLMQLNWNNVGKHIFSMLFQQNTIDINLNCRLHRIKARKSVLSMMRQWLSCLRATTRTCCALKLYQGMSVVQTYLVLSENNWFCFYVLKSVNSTFPTVPKSLIGLHKPLA